MRYIWLVKSGDGYLANPENFMMSTDRHEAHAFDSEQDAGASADSMRESGLHCDVIPFTEHARSNKYPFIRCEYRSPQ